MECEASSCDVDVELKIYCDAECEAESWTAECEAECWTGG